MKISTARRVAFEVLLRVETAAAYAGDLLHAKLAAKPGAAHIASEDAALATELTLGALRWQRRLDHFLNVYTKGRKLDAPVRIALRLGAYQILFLDRIPAHAAVNESVELVKKAGKRSAAGMVNAVLRKLAASGARKDDLPPLPRRASLPEQLAIRGSHPTWLVERWLARFGEENTATLLAANNSPAPVCVLFGGHVEGGALSVLGAQTEPGHWLRSALRVAGGRSAWMAMVEGQPLGGGFQLQDEASQMVAYLLDVRAGQRVLDVCSAPGGKTLTLARAAGPQGRVVAADLHFHRVRGMQQRFAVEKQVAPPMDGARSMVHLLAVDATQPLPFAAEFDRILVDVPCSGTGTLARNPEIRWRLTPDDLLALQARQRAILTNALQILAPGGRLVYSTCSLEPEENEQVVESVLTTRSDCRLVDGRMALQPHLLPDADVNRLFDSPEGAGEGAAGYFRTFPCAHHTDGFFAAIIEKR